MHFRLHFHQSVRVCYDETVHFRHCSHELVLDRCQFTNFMELIPVLNRFKSMRWFPLSNQVWLYHKDDDVYLKGKHSFFRFYPMSWKRYKRNAHPRIVSFLHHEHQHTRDQQNANDERQQLHQSRRPSSTIQRVKQTSSWPTRNAFVTNGEQEKCTTLSRRKDTNFRSNERGGCTSDEERMSIEDTTVEAQFSSEFSDSEESSCERNIEFNTSHQEY